MRAAVNAPRRPPILDGRFVELRLQFGIERETSPDRAKHSHSATEESKLTYGRNEQAVPSEFHVTAPEHSSAKGYDPLYAAFDSPLMRQLRQDAYPFIM